MYMFVFLCRASHVVWSPHFQDFWNFVCCKALKQAGLSWLAFFLNGNDLDNLQILVRDCCYLHTPQTLRMHEQMDNFLWPCSLLYLLNIKFIRGVDFKDKSCQFN